MMRPLFSCVIPEKGNHPYFDEAVDCLESQGVGDNLEVKVQNGDSEPDFAQSSSPSRSSFIHSAVGRVSRKVLAKPIMSRASYRFLRGTTMDIRHDRPSMSCSHTMCMPGCRRMASTISEGMTVCPRSATCVTIVLTWDIIAYLCVVKMAESKKVVGALLAGAVVPLAGGCRNRTNEEGVKLI